MTRVNLVYVQNLADQHLFAEWRELKMVPAALRRSLKTIPVRTLLKSISARYTLNTGHVSFFFNKMRFLQQRYEDLTQELHDRCYDISQHNSSEIFLQEIPSEFTNVDWQPDSDEIAINVDRIVIRLNERPDWYKYYGTTMPPAYFEALYSLQLKVDAISADLIC